ncbi:hypothetical protein COT75_03395 [Candidatus Beckwithbacteria bacterium CG10_big_fil_rev_8_21_14_0_10_34_10]|uniref:Nucleoside 2-deoxyribosyltransferase n=1 Tax=Candidatus Beckwithbacteria bacterium CG10_big_fil_rev_8_21_14_0_10_34_10 TaxID=1974495 RepID=A0A2H0W8V4_9BACT|nr:MAG: hypothetical protein COT75_03395 [Candidatus Beckwithbacteria bacterium CG10_big_fil_rev_8_21_14_0_10_34_10]
MKIYFSSSLRAKKFYQKNFEKISSLIEKLGHQHTSNFIIKANPDDFYNRKNQNFDSFYSNLLSQIKKADVCVFEVSAHSLGIGYCVNLALDLGKPVIALHFKDKEPAFFKGIKNDRFQLHEYTLGNLEEVLKDSLDYVKGLLDIRFTFFVTPKINNFLTWIAKQKKTPRAVYLRTLLEKEIVRKGYKE